jgi:wyosine [tRNA(Phe)-imidazoG37] synthetase (radical SAM superfamily)
MQSPAFFYGKYSMKYKHLFGPVASRRLGFSLGVDMVPVKICNLNCVYCECGTTTSLSAERREWVRADEVIAELSDFLSSSPTIDVVTITGSGEPTLNTGLTAVIGFLKKNFPAYKTALLTNGTLLTLPDVRNAACLFDVVLPSLDAVSDAVFSRINRPHPLFDNKKIIAGIAEFSRGYRGVLWLEVFIVPGINDLPEELSALKDAAKSINPARVQLNTLDRPGACADVVPASAERLSEIASFFSPLAVEIVSRRYNPPLSGVPAIELESMISATLQRRPSTVEDLAAASGRPVNDVFAVLERQKQEGSVVMETVLNRIFYKYVVIPHCGA